MNGGFATPFTPGGMPGSQTSAQQFCMRNCGCYRQGYPGGSGFTTSATISGQVIGTTGTPARNFPMSSNINGNYFASSTDMTGRYAVSATRGSNVTVAPQLQLGVTSMPPSYTFINLQNDAPNRDFRLRAVAPIGSGTPIGSGAMPFGSGVQ